MKRAIFAVVAAILVASVFYYFFYSSPKRSDHLTLYGNVDIRQVDLGFRVQGRVEKMLFEEGDEVHTGDLVGTLEKQPYEDQVSQSKARVASVKADFDNAEKLQKRRQELIKTGGVSQEDLDQASARYAILSANLEEAKAALDTSLTNLNDTKVYAPSDGTILTRIREPGSVVRVADPIYTVSIKNPVWIRAYVNETDLGRIVPNMVAEIRTDTPGGKVYHGRIGFISPVAEFTPKTVETTQLRTDLVYRLRIYVDDAEGLRQGMPVTVTLPIGPS